MEKVLINGTMEENIQETGYKIKCMVKVILHGDTWRLKDELEKELEEKLGAYKSYGTEVKCTSKEECLA